MADQDPRERRPFPLCTGRMRVVRAARLTPQMARIVFTGDGAGELPVEEPGEVITLLWPAPGEDLVLPQLGWRFPDGVPEDQHARNYTVRSVDPAAGELTIDFVLHGDHGRASAWALRAAPGDEIGFAGPRTHWVTDPLADWTLLVADETGLPAVAGILETLPAGHRAVALLEVCDAAEEQELATAADLDLRWLHRGSAPAGTTALLEEAVRALPLPTGTGRAWGAGEARCVINVRRHLAAQPEVRHTSVLGYWKHDTTPDWD